MLNVANGYTVTDVVHLGGNNGMALQVTMRICCTIKHEEEGWEESLPNYIEIEEIIISNEDGNVIKLNAREANTLALCIPGIVDKHKEMTGLRLFKRTQFKDVSFGHPFWKK